MTSIFISRQTIKTNIRKNRHQRAVGLVTWLSGGQQGDHSSIPKKGKRLPFLQSVYIDSRASSAYQLNSNGGFLPPGMGVALHTRLHLANRLRMSGTIPPIPHTFVACKVTILRLYFYHHK